jgi:hypothetical protein
VVRLARYLRHQGLSQRVRAAAAVDAEPAWNPSFRNTRDFFRGYAAYRPGYPLFNYGSLDGGVGHIWSFRQAWYVASGMRYAWAVPEIYYGVMARQWAKLSRMAVRRVGRPVRFAGLMTQHADGCTCGLRPLEAHRALVRALALHPRTKVDRLPAVTNIRWPS